MKIENGAALAGWLASIQGPSGDPLTREQAAELLGLSRATMYATLAVGDQGASPESQRGQIRPQVLATIDALDTLRRVSPAEFAALVARRCSPAGKAGRPPKIDPVSAGQAPQKLTIEGLQRQLAASQAKIDALMLEHCPGDMTAAQLAEYEASQKKIEM